MYDCLANLRLISVRRTNESERTRAISDFSSSDLRIPNNIDLQSFVRSSSHLSTLLRDLPSLSLCLSPRPGEARQPNVVGGLGSCEERTKEERKGRKKASRRAKRLAKRETDRQGGLLARATGTGRGSVQCLWEEKERWP